jgi:hypothetical protein
LQWKMLVFLMDIWCILWPFDLFYGHLVYFVKFSIFFLVLVYCTKKKWYLVFVWGSAFMPKCLKPVAKKEPRLFQEKFGLINTLRYTYLFRKEGKYTVAVRATRWVCEKIAQNVAQPFLQQIHFIYM